MDDRWHLSVTWCHQMETFSALLAVCAGNSPVPGEFPAQRPVMRSFDVFFDLRLNKQLRRQSWGWWCKTQSRSLWRHRNDKCVGQYQYQRSRAVLNRLSLWPNVITAAYMVWWVPPADVDWTNTGWEACWILNGRISWKKICVAKWLMPHYS